MSGNTAQKTAVGRPFRKGYDPRRGCGRKGRSGRPPDEFRRQLAELASREETVAALEAILSDPNHPQFMKALQFAADRGYSMLTKPDSASTPLLVVGDLQSLNGAGGFHRGIADDRS